MRELLGHILPLFEMPVPSEFDLDAMYDELNAQLFDNKLPKIPVVIAKKLGLGGTAHSTIRPGEQYAVPKKITMSDSVDYTDEAGVRGTLAHEMAHVYHSITVPARHGRVANIRKNEADHGQDFQDIVKMIQAKADFAIPVKTLNKDAIKRYIRHRNKTIDLIMYPAKDGSDRYQMIFLAKQQDYDRLRWDINIQFGTDKNIDTIYLFRGIPIPEGYETKKVSKSIRTITHSYYISGERGQELVDKYKPLDIDAAAYREEAKKNRELLFKKQFPGEDVKNMDYFGGKPRPKRT